ncbi:MAG: site-2 protease family protein [Gammaproteobacteria bacterium]|nr:MAG: site-2 protease family protein [Gammaproteobacteria bacterium]
MQQLTLVQKLAVAVIPVLYAITLHEVAHGWVARRFGDRTAEMLGRLTVNPLKHVDPIGTVVVPALSLMLGGFLFGWAKPVPVSVRNLGNPRRDMILVAAAGPVANLVMALFWAIVARATLGLGLEGSAAVFLLGMAQIGVLINVILAVFNMFPLPPLDGGRVMAGLLPPAQAARFERLEQYGLIIILALLFTGVLWRLLGPIMSFVNDLVLTVAGF